MCVAHDTGPSDGGPVGGAMGGGNAVGSYDLDDFGDMATIPEKQDFAYMVRSKVASEHKQRSTVSGFEVRSSSVLLVNKEHVFSLKMFA